jgi:phosphoribosyl 1,2-cyclic phosphate phosphodiesterase
MKITFLGTSAANAFPEAFCKCKNCEEARLLGGPSLRKRSSLLINADLLIDLGPDIMTASQMHGCSLSDVCYCLQTHPHSDHLDLSHLLSRSPESGTIGTPILDFYASAETLRKAAETFERDLTDFDLLSPDSETRLRMKIHPIEPYQPFTFGDYRAVAFPANHAPGMGAMLYSVESGGSTIFYGADTAALYDQTWQAFHRFQMQFDLVILDHTYGMGQPGSNHLSTHQVIEHVQRMRREGLLKPDGRAFATHIAHEGNPAHPELVAFAAQNGYEVAYDGLILEI